MALSGNTIVLEVGVQTALHTGTPAQIAAGGWSDDTDVLAFVPESNAMWLAFALVSSYASSPSARAAVELHLRPMDIVVGAKPNTRPPSDQNQTQHYKGFFPLDPSAATSAMNPAQLHPEIIQIGAWQPNTGTSRIAYLRNLSGAIQEADWELWVTALGPRQLPSS